MVSRTFPVCGRPGGPPSSEYARVLGPNFESLQLDSQDITKEFVNVFWGLKPEEEPLRPEAIAIMRQNRGTVPQCLPPGIPISTFVYAFKFVQAPQEIVMITGTGDPPRQIYLDGRKLPKDPDPTWMGYSSGRWEGEMLLWRRLDSMGEARWTRSAIRAASPCTSQSASSAATSATWIWK